MPEDRWRRAREFISCFYKAEERAESIKVEIIHEVALQQQQKQEEEEEEEESGEKGKEGLKVKQDVEIGGGGGGTLVRKDFNLRLAARRWLEGDPDPSAVNPPDPQRGRAARYLTHMMMQSAQGLQNSCARCGLQMQRGEKWRRRRRRSKMWRCRRRKRWRWLSHRERGW